MKLRLSAAALVAFALSSTAALAQSAPATSAASPSSSTSTAPDKTTLSYALGYQFARELAERNTAIDTATLIRAIQDGYAKREPTMPAQKLGQALKTYEEQETAKARAEFEKVVRDNKAKSDAFLAANRAKTGVTVLPSGVQYRIIEAGSGAKPSTASTVQAHLRGSISTGQEFANTYQSPDAQPATFKVGDFPLAGVKEALLLMPSGSRWEVYVPADKAYGNDPRSPIGPAQAVVFDIKLISVK